MNPKYIIVQAGGKGTRMASLTANKPKALVPVDGLPIIFHLFRKYPDKKFIVIGDYKEDVLERYLKTFAEVDYKLVSSSGHTGTCSGINEALSFVPNKEAFMLIWCDLLLPEDYQFPCEEGNYIGISKDFPCRWKYENNEFFEEVSSEHGVAGHFIFSDKNYLSALPTDGELVRWMHVMGMTFLEQPLYHTKEYGLISEWEKIPRRKCRPFNRIEEKENKIYKIPLDEQGRSLAVREGAWYKKIQDYCDSSSDTKINIPDIYSFDPLCMELIVGENIYDLDYLSPDEKLPVLENVISTLRRIHSLEKIPADRDSYHNAYIGKTKDRLNKVKNLIPFAQDQNIRINGKLCRNIFYCWDEVEKLVMDYCPEQFCFIHGDPTFSNIMVRSEDSAPVLIDPRGYFGTTEIYGDAAYDWVKLYYSLFSNYDRFNLKQFYLLINPDDVELDINSNNWESLEDDFFRLLDGEITKEQMKLLLAVIWLSLTTYAWEDYDSICGAFYNGIYYLEEALERIEASSTKEYFNNVMRVLDNAVKDMKWDDFGRLVSEMQYTLTSGHKIVTSGLGKNVSVCEKFTGTMVSMGLDANFLHTNSAVHGDMGMVHPGDLVIVLTKSGCTEESIYLVDLLIKRQGVNIWMLSFCEKGPIVDIIGREKCLIVNMEHEGDPWNVVPNNSTTLTLILLQGLAMELAKRMKLTLNDDFAPNHPGGAIGEKLK